MPYDVITFIRKIGVVITIYAFSSLAFLDQSAIDNTGHSYPQNKSTAEKMKFSIADLVRFTEEICNEKLHFLCSDVYLTMEFYPSFAIWLLQSKITSSLN